MKVDGDHCDCHLPDVHAKAGHLAIEFRREVEDRMSSPSHRGVRPTGMAAPILAMPGPKYCFPNGRIIGSSNGRKGTMRAVSSRRVRMSFGSGPLAAAAVLGVLAGSRAGLWFGGRAKARSVKILMAVVLALVSAVYFMKIT